MKLRPALVLALLAGGGACLATVPATWISATTATVAGDVPVRVTGASVPLAGAGALVTLAAAAALLLASPRLARLVGGVAALLGGLGLVGVLGVLVDPSGVVDEAARAVTGLPWTGGATTLHPAAWLASLGLLLGTVAGVLTVLLGGRLGRTSRRFDPPASAHVRSMDDWDALGRGEDPSLNPGNLESEGGTT